MDSTAPSNLRSRTVTWEDPAPAVAALRREPGLDYLRKIASADHPAPPMGHLMNLRLVVVERGRIVYEATPQEYHYNASGVVHGGFAATILDSAMGCAVHSWLDGGDRYTTLELKVNYLKAMTTATGPVRAIATLVSIGRTVALAEARLVDFSDVLYAHGTSTLLIKRADG